MDETRDRLTKCFALLFPDLSAAQIAAASQATVSEWDSVAALTMLNVIEDEFGIQIDLDEVAELDSFERLLAYLEPKVASD